MAANPVSTPIGNRKSEIGNVVVHAESLGKCYEIYNKPAHRLLQTLFHGRRIFFQEFWALRDVSFEIHRGETLGIIGRNGAGKSTLLQLLCGTLTPTTGSITTTGRIAALLELGAGFNPEFTGRENVYFNARIMGLTREQTDARFDDIAAFADIGDFMEQPVKTYSSGMYVRLAFAVIAHLDADVLVIDEALAVGDVFFTQKCMRFLRSFREKGTIVFVSHDSAAVMNLCHRALWLDQGRLRSVGPAKEVSETYFATFYQTQNSNPESATNPLPAPITETPAEIENRKSKIENHSFGTRHASITSVQLLRVNGSPLTAANTRETVSLVITATAHQPIAQAIAGFYVKDRLGQNLFGENTCRTYADKPIAVAAGQTLTARFTFEMPLLLPGDYTIDVSLAEGTQDHHVQHHWLRDALAFRSTADTESTGLVGIPMLAIELACLGGDA